MLFHRLAARNKEFPCNPHRPEGLRRNGIVFVVVGFSQWEPLPRRRLLESNTVWPQRGSPYGDTGH